VDDRYTDLIAHLRGASRPDRQVPPEAEDYVATVRQHAYRVTDAQVEALRASGLTEDEVFELTVAAAVGAGLDRLDAGLRAMQ
jgi:alkylhydroperoxidase family enzyme